MTEVVKNYPLKNGMEDLFFIIIIITNFLVFILGHYSLNFSLYKNLGQHEYNYLKIFSFIQFQETFLVRVNMNYFSHSFGYLTQLNLTFIYYLSSSLLLKVSHLLSVMVLCINSYQFIQIMNFTQNFFFEYYFLESYISTMMNYFVQKLLMDSKYQQKNITFDVDQFYFNDLKLAKKTYL